MFGSWDAIESSTHGDRIAAFLSGADDSASCVALGVELARVGGGTTAESPSRVGPAGLGNIWF